MGPGTATTAPTTRTCARPPSPPGRTLPAAPATRASAALASRARKLRLMDTSRRRSSSRAAATATAKLAPASAVCTSATPAGEGWRDTLSLAGLPPSPAAAGWEREAGGLLGCPCCSLSRANASRRDSNSSLAAAAAATLPAPTQPHAPTVVPLAEGRGASAEEANSFGSGSCRRTAQAATPAALRARCSSRMCSACGV
eukprot:scaffold12224_cov98-Isochrysis_galbana.AAC.3